MRNVKCRSNKRAVLIKNDLKDESVIEKKNERTIASKIISFAHNNIQRWLLA